MLKLANSRQGILMLPSTTHLPGETYNTTSRYKDSDFQSLDVVRGKKVATIEGNNKSEIYGDIVGVAKLALKCRCLIVISNPTYTKSLLNKIYPSTRPCSVLYLREEKPVSSPPPYV